MKYLFVIFLLFSNQSVACTESHNDFVDRQKKAYDEFLIKLAELKENSDLIFTAILMDKVTHEKDGHYSIKPIFEKVIVLKGEINDAHNLEYIESKMINVSFSCSYNGYNLHESDFYIGAKYLVYSQDGIIKRAKIFIDYPIEQTTEDELKGLVK